MTQLKEETDIFVTRYTSLEASDPASAWSWLDELRAGGIRRFQSLGYPGPRDEEWKYTSVAPL
ncbi:MAG: hypothetical protein JXA90_04235, partial [Planctomycetes bacterium]|nr:hypothetical protein [Planctomycetota bacterium]